MSPSSTLVPPQTPSAPPAPEPWSWGNFRLRHALPAAGSSETYELHLAAVEYALASSIAIRGPEDIQSKVHWEGRFDPFAHQAEKDVTGLRLHAVGTAAKLEPLF